MSAAEPVHIRRADGELIGVLVPTENMEWIPCTMFGAPLGGPQSRERAEEFLHRHGLGYLAEKWLYLEDGDWVVARIVEASPTHVTITFADYQHPDLFGKTRVLAVPVGQSLRIR